MNPKVEKALNEQMHAEFFSFYLYLSVAAYFTALHLDGFAHWMRIQAQEELAHAMKLFDYINERGGMVELMALEAPQREWPSPSAAIEAVLEHEKFITGKINELASLAFSENDFTTFNFLQWFIEEQDYQEAICPGEEPDCHRFTNDTEDALVYFDGNVPTMFLRLRHQPPWYWTPCAWTRSW